MRYLLVLPLIVYTIGDTFRLALSLGPGLSLKNGTVYVVGLMLVMRTVIRGRGGSRFELPTIHICFAILIAYAACSLIVAGFIVRYDDYHIVDSVITLKASLIDNAIILGLFFYGTRTIKDGLFLTKAIVAAVTVANVICLASIWGFLDIPGVRGLPEEGGRVPGPFGHPNETAALVAAVIPAYVAIMRSSRGVGPLVWIAGAASSIAMLFMTASRGAFVAMLLGYPWMAYVFRRYLSLRQVLLWSGGVLVLGAVILSLLGTHFVSLVLERIVTESSASDIGALSSGRSGIWTRALEQMLTMPITLITGFGWNAYEAMGFRYAPHNTYLLAWFELGLVGLLCFCILLLRTVSTVRAAVAAAEPLSRSYLMAFVFGFVAFSITLFFGNLYEPWMYVWAYAGVSLRMALVTAKADTSPSASSLRAAERPLVELRKKNVVAARSSRVPPAQLRR
jgi:O-antigen ligase